MEKFFAAFRNMFTVPDLRKRILFTLGLLAVYRLGAHITAPGVDRDQLRLVWEKVGTTLLGVLDLFSGGNFQTISVFALGVTPYITATIITQLMTTVFPQLKRLQEEGEAGRQKLNQYNRYLTVVLCMFQTFIVARWLQANAVLPVSPIINVPVLSTFLDYYILSTIITLTTGTIFVMWLGEQITERGIGNGVSLLIFAGIIIGLPSRGVPQVLSRLKSGDTFAVVGVIAMLAILLGLIAFIVFVESARRKVPISYAKRHVGRQLVGGQQTHMPIKLNMGGVIPVIFASSVLAIPQTVLQFIAYDPTVQDWRFRVHSFFTDFHGGDPYYELVYLSLIVLFTFFYITIIFNVEEVSDNLRKHGGFIPGIRPGRNTAEFLNTILTRLTTVGAIYLAFVAFVPQLMLSGFNVGRLPFFGGRIEEFVTGTPGLGWIPHGMGYQFYFGGTSLLILVGVAMDTAQQIEAQLVMRNYEGFFGPGSRLRGRRT
ncbi:MAG: preprotein translocase subunit SecY [Acidobacteria bacterium]|nr:MAG: preprotein translocase subunit SecY [Acidobacteriota bacterium]PYS81485.1 MAG: preprotein translocase subunit SecY [Acidobacteriota bacterium]